MLRGARQHDQPVQDRTLLDADADFVVVHNGVSTVEHQPMKTIMGRVAIVPVSEPKSIVSATWSAFAGRTASRSEIRRRHSTQLALRSTWCRRSETCRLR